MHPFLLEYMFEMLSCLVSLICFGDVNRSTAIHIFSFTQKKHACTSVCTMSCPYVGISKITNKKICARDVSRQNVWIKAQPFQHHHLLWMTFLFIIYFELFKNKFMSISSYYELLKNSRHFSTCKIFLNFFPES